MDSIAYHKEPTWGDYDKIINIASNLSSNTALTIRMHYILALLPSYQDEIKDFQIIRNAFIHLNDGAIKELESLRNLYVFSTHSNVVNILNATRIGNTSPCFKSMTDNMIGVLNNIYEG